jgi:hypothetical protein
LEPFVAAQLLVQPINILTNYVGERLSAVAKRRRLNGNLAAPSPSLAPIVKPQRAPSLNPDQPASEGNTFAALADNDIVNFSTTKEVATVAPGAVAIRLSKGEVSVYHPLLDAPSSNLHPTVSTR